MSHIVQHTIRRGEIFHFNIRIPNTNNLYRRSLRTDSPSKARKLIGIIKNYIDDIGCEMIKSDIDTFIEMLISNKLNQVVRVSKAITSPLSQSAKGQYTQYYHQTDPTRFELYNLDHSNHGYSQSTPRPTIQPYNEWVSDKLKKVASYDYGNTHFFKTDEDGNTEVNEEAAFYDEFEFPTVHAERYNHLNDIVTSHTNNLASAALANQSLRFRAELKELEAKFAPLLPNSIPAITAPITSEAPLFKDLLPKYLAYQDKESTRDLTEHKRHMEIWSIAFGDMRIDEISIPVIREAWGVFSELPRKQTSKLAPNPYAGLPAQERWVAATDDEINIDPTLYYSWENARKYRQELSTFFSWCVSIHQCSIINPLADPKNLKYLYNFSERRIARTKFSKEIASNIITYCKNNLNEVKNWGVLIMAYHGMRNSEVLGLTKKSVVVDEDTGVVSLNITEGKTKNATRKVPVHKELLKLGFMEFVNNSDNRLFDVIDSALTLHYHNVLKPELGIPDMSNDGKRLSLYSFRHYVITALVTNGTNQAIQNALVGHTNAGSQAPYVHLELVQLQNVIDKISYE